MGKIMLRCSVCCLSLERVVMTFDCRSGLGRDRERERGMLHSRSHPRSRPSSLSKHLPGAFSRECVPRRHRGQGRRRMPMPPLYSVAKPLSIPRRHCLQLFAVISPLCCLHCTRLDSTSIYQLIIIDGNIGRAKIACAWSGAYFFLTTEHQTMYQPFLRAM